MLRIIPLAYLNTAPFDAPVLPQHVERLKAINSRIQNGELIKNEIMNQLAEKSSMNEEYILNQIAHTQILLQERLDNQQEIINRLEYLTFKKIENSTVSGCSQKKGGWNILVDGYDQKIQREIEKWERVKMRF